MLKFALKATTSTTFGTKWFPKNTVGRDARKSTRRVYMERANKTERSKNNPLQYMARVLNEHYRRE